MAQTEQPETQAEQQLDTSEIPDEPTKLAPATMALIGGDGKPTRDGWRWINQQLRLPFTKVKTRSGRGGKSFKYITARQVFDRLDRIVGPGNWDTAWEPLSVEWPQVARVGIAVFGVWRWDVGYCNNSDEIEPTKQRASGDTWYKVEPEGMKAAVSDGIKRAAVHHGIGRYLYNDD